MSEKTIFQKIINGEIPADKLHEDEYCIAINDISPQAPVHILVIPKKLITRIGEAVPEDHPIIGHLMMVAGRLGNLHDGGKGFRVIVNNGPAGGESVPHLHVHVLAGRQMIWPPG